MRVALLFAAVLNFAAPAFAADADLARLREAYARDWFNPEAHLRLAKHLADHGDRLTAFYISETARRSHFPEEVFDHAVRLVFLDDPFDNGLETERRLQADLEKSPEDVEKLIKLADVHLSRGEWKQAETYLKKALVLDPESTAIWPLAEVLRRDGREAEGDTLEEEWLAVHPESREAWAQRVETAMRAESPEALKTVDAALEKFPEDAQVHFNRARLLHRAGDLAGATAEYVRAAGLDPRSALIQGWTARFFLKAREDEEKALEYYLNAYFLDPHFYDTEYAESRVRGLAYRRGAARFAVALEDGKSAVELLQHEDPVVAGFALQEVSEHWTAGALPRLIALLAHDDDSLRYGSADVIALNVDAGFDEQLGALLQSPDLRVRSAAAYIAGARWKEKVVPIMISWLEHPVDLLRYDAVSVLFQSGGAAGEKAVRDCASSGKCRDARVKLILDAMDEPASPEDDR